MASGLVAPEPDAPTDNATPAAQAEAAPVSVSVRRSIAEAVEEEAEITARTAPIRAVELRAETQGRVVSLQAQAGDRLAENDLILALSQEDRPARLDRAEAVLAQRELQWEAAQKLSEKGYQTRAGVAEARANLASARADVAAIRDELDKTRIRAPFDGVLETRPVEKGDLLRVGDTVGRLVQQSPFLVVGDVSEDVVARIEEGQAGSARLISGETVTGTVRYVAGEADEQTRTYRVELRVSPEAGRLIAGATATLRLPLGTVPAHVVEPAVMTLDDDGAFGIKTVDERDRVHFHPAEIVRNRDGRVWLTGLPEALRIITVGQGFVREGDQVDPQTDNAAAAESTAATATDPG
ncbi:MAG: efflux transporter periplasmic adaptor subunit [Salinisphaeraceae bacterium]|nr:efflux transporter periplasmic adaptor subunit [Salinisphaeraceae bacterium]